MTPNPCRRLADRLMAAAAWGAVAGGGAIVASQRRRRTGTRLSASAQTMTPFLAAALVPVALWAVGRRRRVLAVGAGSVGAASLALAAPVLFPGPRPRAAPGTADVRVATVNLLYTNGRTAEIAADLARRDADVVVFTECTEMHLAALHAHPLAERYPHRVDRPGPRAEGVAVWSRLAMVERPPLATVNHSVDVTVEGPDGSFRLVGVHTPTPVYDVEQWAADLEAIREGAAAGDRPTLLIGDFNATYWHPGFRRLLDAGFVDAHIATGRGFAASWPVGGPIPPFAQLDHALTARGLVATDVENFDVAGSDHRAVVVTVRAARRPTT